MTTPVLEPLLPCPFCGNRSGATSDNSHGVVYVYCTNAACSSDGPVADSAEQAIAAWNRRPSPADQRPVRSAREVVHEAIRRADARGCCNLPSCAFPPRPGFPGVDTMLCDELAAMLEQDRASRSPRDGEALHIADLLPATKAPAQHVADDPALMSSYSVGECLRQLAEATEHLLSDHSCDHHGHEGVRYAQRAALAHAAALAAPAAAPPQEKEPPK